MTMMREATRGQNARNRKRAINNTSGTTGVYKHSSGKYWTAEIEINRKRKYLGLFSTKKNAIIARQLSQNGLDFHTNHGNE